ncbi:MULTISPECIES: hypothetical protein [Pseudomonas]|uniref:Uncharacterized protein n=1 Tax=Pseudomonas fluorescens TaxID=294 RepID=A0A7M2JDQ4_PSEFL|nr:MULTISPECIES: hypothetical protein [Pseudomonas]QOU07253.1 hypothetical protein IM720_11195 [Pseudomonas fluorescens]
MRWAATAQAGPVQARPLLQQTTEAAQAGPLQARPLLQQAAGATYAVQA